MKQILLLTTLFISLIGYAQTQIGQDINGEAADDYSGRSVSFSSDGSILAIGASGNDGNGVDSGHVRVYGNQSGVWTQIGQDIDGEAAGDNSGHSVSLSSDGNILAISARRNAGNNALDSETGHVRVYSNQGGVWTQIGQDIDGEAAGDKSGDSVSLSADGSTVAIGSTQNAGTNGLGSQTGHVRVYFNQSGVWTQIGQDIDGEGHSDFSGSSVSLSSDGNIVAIGAKFNDGDASTEPHAGHVRVYSNQGGVWTQIGQDIDGVFGSEDESGFSVSLSSDGSIVAIGAPESDTNGYNTGHVSVYGNQSGVWTQIGQDIIGEAAGDNFGYSVSLSSDGSILAIGGIWNAGSGAFAGHVRVYKNQSSVWTQIGEDIDAEAAEDQLGSSVSLSSDGSVLAIGARTNDDNGNDSGHVRVFSIASELAIIEVIDDIAGNSNGINITAAELNSIDGVSGAIEGVNYTTALGNGTFVDSNNPTASEIQAIVDMVNAALSVNENDIFSFNLYPNPTTNQFTIQLNNTTTLENVNIFDNLGKLVLISKEETINTTNLSAGLYIIEIQTNKGKSSKKLIIE